MAVPNSELTAALLSARTTPEILAALARVEYRKEHPGRDCPAHLVPYETALHEWLPQCPVTAQAEARTAAAAMRLIDPVAELFQDERSSWRGFGDPEARAQAQDEAREMFRMAIGAGELPRHFDPEKFIANTLARIARLVFAIARFRPVSPIGRMPGGMGIMEFGVLELPEIHRRWLDLPDVRCRHPLAPIVAAWQERPVEVEPERRKDKRILPVVRITESRPERVRGMLFGGLHEGRYIEAPELPLFPEVAPAKRVPLLDLVDAAGLPVMARGRGAPLQLRLFVRTLASVRLEHRGVPTVRLTLTLRELRDGLFPGGSYRSVKDWPKLRHALMTARDYAIHDGGGRWWPLALRSMPDNPGLDHRIVLDVAFPPESHSGPVVNLRAMDSLSVDSAARWRAYIAAHSLAWQPGSTRVPAPRAGGRYLWTRDRSAYPVLTLEDRRRLAFGADDVKHRTRAEIDSAWRGLPGLVVVNESEARDRTGEVGWLVLPEDAAGAVRRDDEGDPA